MNNLFGAIGPFGNILTQVNQLKNQFAGRRPEDIINEMLKSGQINQAQVDRAKQMAEQFRSIMR